MIEHGMELMVPGIGEIVPLDDPQKVALALDAVRDLERELRLVKNELTNAIVYASQIAGTKTLHLEGVKATIKGGSSVVYDAVEIEKGLREVGMPEERIREIIKETVTYSVDGVRAKQAAGANPVYAEIIERGKTVVEANPYVTLSLSPHP
jgi:hypothetical protein